MRRGTYQQRLAAHFVQPQLAVEEGTIFAAPRPLDLEGYVAASDPEFAESDPTLTSFERVLTSGHYQLVLSLSWGTSASSQTLDLGLLRTHNNQLFVVHQVDDDAGTALIIAYLSAALPLKLLGPFLIDYLSSRGSAYMVTLPGLLPRTIWVARPDLVSHATVAHGLLGLVGGAALRANASVWGGGHRMVEGEAEWHVGRTAIA